MEDGDARWLEWLLPMLAWVSGGADAVSYLALGHVFIANMTGNTVLLGLALGASNASRALGSVLAMLGFALGVALGVALLRRCPWGWSAKVNRVLLIEAGLLAGALATFAWVGAAPVPAGMAHGLVGLLGLAMGLQSAAVRQIHLVGVQTTFITGTLTDWVAGLVKHAPSRGLPLGRVQITVYAIYGLAALVTAFLHQRWPPLAITLPWLVLLATVILGAMRLRRASRRPES